MNVGQLILVLVPIALLAFWAWMFADMLVCFLTMHNNTPTGFPIAPLRGHVATSPKCVARMHFDCGLLDAFGGAPKGVLREGREGVERHGTVSITQGRDAKTDWTAFFILLNFAAALLYYSDVYRRRGL